MRPENIIILFLVATVFVLAATIYKTPSCTIDDIQTALAGMEFVVE